jgi:hypothetical protein
MKRSDKLKKNCEKNVQMSKNHFIGAKKQNIFREYNYVGLFSHFFPDLVNTRRFFKELGFILLSLQFEDFVKLLSLLGKILNLYRFSHAI